MSEVTTYSDEFKTKKGKKRLKFETKKSCLEFKTENKKKDQSATSRVQYQKTGTSRVRIKKKEKNCFEF